MPDFLVPGGDIDPPAMVPVADPRHMQEHWSPAKQEALALRGFFVWLWPFRNDSEAGSPATERGAGGGFTRVVRTAGHRA